MKIEGIHAVVTGGGSGLGEATTRRLVGSGARASIFDLEASRGNEIADELGDAVGFHPVDVRDADGMAAAVDAAVGDQGALRLLVNCAGVGTPAKTLDREGQPLDLDWFSRVIEINLIGTFNAIRLAAATMVKNDPNAGGERGVIVNTASVAAFEGQIGQAAYAASKGGVVSMTLPIARELARDGVRVCAIAPGLFGTPMLMGLPQAARESLGASVPFPPRLGAPDEYASLVCHIVENAMLNGETIRLDGAIRMAPK
jgi:NAD(P)-dependent dehydrogenase (short-subunit alcohol dehydrogenase family)